MDDDSIDISGLSFEDKVSFLEEELPKPIRDFLRSPERDAVSLRLSQKYALHADQAGSFEKAYLYMLLGVNTPDDFIADLKDAGISQDTIRGLTTDINEQVFKKLQQEELRPSQGAPAAIPQYTAPAPRPIVVPVAPTPPVIVAPAVGPIQQPAPAPVSETPSFNLIRTAPAAPSPQAAAPIPPQAPTTPSAPEIRTMAHDMQAMQQTPTQAVVTNVQPATMPHPSQMSPAMTFQTASVPYSPVQEESGSLSTYTPIVHMPNIPPLSNRVPSYSLPPTSGIAPIKEYSGDPYREPLS